VCKRTVTICDCVLALWGPFVSIQLRSLHHYRPAIVLHSRPADEKRVLVKSWRIGLNPSPVSPCLAKRRKEALGRDLQSAEHHNIVNVTVQYNTGPLCVLRGQRKADRSRFEHSVTDRTFNKNIAGPES